MAAVSPVAPLCAVASPWESLYITLPTCLSTRLAACFSVCLSVAYICLCLEIFYFFTLPFTVFLLLFFCSLLYVGLLTDSPVINL